MQFRINSLLVAFVAVALLVGTAGVAQADLVGHWTFDETSGATAYDSTSYNHDGTIDTTSGNGPTLGQSGKIGTSFLFKGQPAGGTGGVEVPYSSTLDDLTTNITLSQWFYMTEEPANASWMINKHDASVGNYSYVSWVNIGGEKSYEGMFGSSTSYTGPMKLDHDFRSNVV